MAERHYEFESGQIRARRRSEDSGRSHGRKCNASFATERLSFGVKVAKHLRKSAQISEARLLSCDHYQVGA